MICVFVLVLVTTLITFLPVIDDLVPFPVYDFNILSLPCFLHVHYILFMLFFPISFTFLFVVLIYAFFFVSDAS